MFKEQLEKLIVNAALNGAYEDAGQRVLSTDVITATINSIINLVDKEVIGEDEPDETDKWTPEMESYIRQARQVIYGRNALKAEQRKRAKELFGVEE